MKYFSTKSLNNEKFAKSFENRVKSTIKEFNLFSKKQKLLVAASGGKDSTVLLYLLNKFGYDVEAITINAHIGCYSDSSLENLKKFCKKNKIKLHEITLRKEFGSSLCYIISSLNEKGLNKTSCSVCGTLRRYLLNKHARKLNAKIILTGHNLDDEADGILMALFSGNLNRVARIGPITTKGAFVVRAKPLYFVFEDEVERYSKLKKFDVSYEWCPCSAKGARRFYSELGLNPEKKFNLVANVVKNLKKLKKHFQGEELKQCSVCKEPCSNEICQTCNLLLMIKDIKSKKLTKEINKFTCK